MNDEFRTIVNPGSFSPSIGVNSPVMLMGSCFSENMGDAFRRRRLPVLINPTGIVYNPISIIRSLEMLLGNEQIEAESMVFHNERWQHFDFHGRFSDVGRDQALCKMNQSLKQGRAFLKEASYLILTLGSAYVYQRVDDGCVVANCHKFPDIFFSRHLLPFSRIVTRFQALFEGLKSFNPHLNVVFTVSPVRHWKDGAHGNQLSKSTLLLAVNDLCRSYEKVNYFPAYEIIMDELRDYRFYDESMLHPSQQAVKYIWSRFEEAFISSSARGYIRQTLKIANAREHRLMGQPTEAYLQFLKKTIALIDRVEKEFSVPFLRDDRNYFLSLLNSSSNLHE